METSFPLRNPSGTLQGHSLESSTSCRTPGSAGHRVRCDAGLLIGREKAGGCVGGQRPPQHTIAAGLDCRCASGKYRAYGWRRRDRSFPPWTKLFLANSHQNSHSLKIKMAADLAASHLVDFKVFLAPQVGLEPTTLRLTARHLHFSGLLSSALYCAFSEACGRYALQFDREDYPQLLRILRQYTHKIPHSENCRLFAFNRGESYRD
jgi:hypothetical protein